MKRITIALLVIASMAMPFSATQAQEYPAKQISLVVPFPAGGPSDLLARTIADQMSKKLPRRVLVENFSGASGSIGTSRVAKSSPDGYTLIFGTIGTFVANLALYKSLPYHPQNDFEPVALLGAAPLVLVAGPAIPADNFQGFTDYIKNNIKNVTYGSAGPGSIAHMGCLILMSSMKTDVQHVPYKGVAPATAAVMGGEVGFMCDQSTTALTHIRGGKLKAMAVLLNARIPQLPNIPTAAEQGYPDVNVKSWNAVFAPKGTPKSVIEKLNLVIQDVLQDTALRTQMADLGVELSSRGQASPERLRKLLASEIDKLVPLLRSKQGYLD